MFLDYKVNFQEHLGNMLNKVNKNIGFTTKITKHSSQIIIIDCMSIIRPHLDYDDIIYDQAYNASFQ